MNNKNIIFIAATLVLIVAIFVWWQAMQKKTPQYAGTIDEITLAPLQSEALSLIWVAENEDLFAKNGLKVTILPTAPGDAVIAALASSTADMATVGEYTFVNTNIEKNNFNVIASIDTGETIQLLARTESGIAQIADLKGKMIGVVPKTESEFVLSAFLVKNNLSATDTKVVSLSTSNIVSAMIDGEVDAVVTSEPNIHTIKKSLGDKVVAWAVQSEQPHYIVLVSKKDFIDAHPRAVEKFVNTLVQAEDFVKKNPERSQQIVAGRLGIDLATLGHSWIKHTFTVTLQEEMVALMIDEARRNVLSKLTDNTQVPKFRNFIYFDALQKVKPDAITITRK